MLKNDVYQFSILENFLTSTQNSQQLITKDMTILWQVFVKSQ